MFSALRTVLLKWLLVPADPEPPVGSPGSLKVFRAGQNLYMLKLFMWALKQCVLLLATLALVLVTGGPRSPQWFIPVLRGIRIVAILAYVIQFALTYAALRLNFELRWYMVTDRSLRIRAGIWSIQELTMTFANVQQVKLTQGPLQRILGIADLVVTSAGGTTTHTSHGATIHTAHGGTFEGVENADAIRDLILDRLKRYRDAGLGDPDDHHHAEVDTEQAAQQVLLEARQLRKALTQS